MKDVEYFLRNNLSLNEGVVVACSGGPDSMCLLSLVNKLREELNLKVVCAHVNHKVRVESDEEAKVVEDFANKNDDIFEYMEITDYLNSDFSEEDARKRRYKFFDGVVKKHQAKTLLTAHHGDDLIETILMRLTRGSNLNGYIGIRKASENDEYQILRPLLSVSKEEILSYLKEQNITYVTDESNNNDTYTRNRYRHNIVPFLKKENKNVHQKYLKFSEELSSYEDFVNSYIYNNGFIVDKKIVTSKVSGETSFIKRKCLEALIRDIQKMDILNISDANMNELMKLYKLENKSIDLNNGYKGVNSYGDIFIVKNNDNSFNEVIIDKDIKINDFIFYYNPDLGNDSNDTIYLNSKEIDLPLKIRSWQEGDKMKVKNLNGTKKISDIFTNSKIPKYKRNNYPILVDNKNEVLWVPGVKKSQFAKDKKEKYDIIIRCKAR